MQLSKQNLQKIDTTGVDVPPVQLFSLPEKVLQFGTGVLLRGLPDYFIDKANKQNIFNGRIVVVKSTGMGATDSFAKQDGLYTLLERGVVNGKQTEQTSINASISRVLSANEEWERILQCAANPEMQLVLSNTTEVGIALVEEDAVNEKPVSFPGRLLFFLLERFRVFDGSDESGMVIVPTELIVDNGAKLRKIILTLAKLKNVSARCLQWLDEKNEFCNSLVDCIVPGKLPAAEQQAVEQKLGYSDELMIMSEPYRLWAIETSSERAKEILSFSTCNQGVILAPDINKFRELKLRLLNATHTLSCGLAHLSGFSTVKEAMRDGVFVSYVSALMHEEIIPLVAQGNISVEEANQFAQQVIDRFRNPYIEHLWLSITAQYTSKIAMRVVPLVEKQYAAGKATPELMALGFAAFLRFMDSQEKDGGYYGTANGVAYRIQDDLAALLHNHWQNAANGTIAEKTLCDERVFGADLSQYPGFAAEVSRMLEMLQQHGAANTLRSIFAKKTVA
ncbi:tagaturonate reductase [Sediminibacterium roseum]|uniref:Tagaturonate reductase n=1 Tax=Sediminibacterium roseum TaxID=1978412 RepID=A0ABW9ZZ72_9BACT|nr:tagaturonate reductase [Sediminibacterium roseum]NCI51622.1 tagaturonate reductase [Sediminibacterium roseum]